jgi:hypothetical protein
MALRRLCKAANSFPQDKCPAVYVEEDDPSTMVGQGKRMSAKAKAELRDLAAEEDAVRIPTERSYVQLACSSPSKAGLSYSPK